MNRPVHGGNLAWAAAIADCPTSSIVDFSASINPLGPPSSAIAAIQRGFAHLSVYPDPDYSQLRLALAKWHQIPPEWILPGNGSAELLTWASWELSDLETTYLITPAFSDYRRGLSAFGAKVLDCPLDLDDSKFEGWCRDIPWNISTNSGDRGLLLNNPHNPTGKLWKKAEILPYLEKFALVVVDEAFMDFLPPSQEQSLIPYAKEFNNLVILRSLTKFYSLPGLRLGYAIAHPDRLKLWQKRRDPWSVNILAAVAAEAVIGDRAFQEKTWHWLPTAREELFQDLSAIEGLQPLPGAANFLLVKTENSSTKLQEELLKKQKILIRDCLSFPELGDRYFRIAVRSQQENQRLVEALRSCYE
ncbi:MAG: threonine-phosphate decarboxylase CobD [Xenococcaceae cyanobacterium]